jgi:hypothetical protein
MGSTTYPGTPLANPLRAYPPSCAAWPLPDAASGGGNTVYSQRVTLFAQNGTQAGTTEDVTITVWRLACSSSGAAAPYNPNGYYNAMTLLRIDRDAGNDGTSTVYPSFPDVESGQNGAAYLTSAATLVRMAVDPNTYESDTQYDSPVVNSTTYVLENYPYAGSGYFKFSDAIPLRIYPGLDNSDGTPYYVEFDIPAYSPTQATYPDAYNPLYLDGYAAAQWSNSAGNQGLITQVSEQYDSGGNLTRQLIVDLQLLDLNGNPFMLVGNAAFQTGQTSITLNLAYLINGFATTPWGTATAVIQDCNHMNLTFTPNSQLPSPIPSFSGTTTYGRIFNANGMICE